MLQDTKPLKHSFCLGWGEMLSLVLSELEKRNVVRTESKEDSLGKMRHGDRVFPKS